MSDNIKVVVKVRPLISREIEDKLFYQWRVQNDTLYQIDQNGKDVGPEFTFDKVYNEDTKTSDVYNDIAKPIVEAATAGFNGTIFAYGQTSSGKTYTMTGTEEAPGIIPLAILNLFEIIKNIPNRDFLVRVSYLEIYNETLIDLLNLEKKNIKIQDSHQGVKVDATEKVTSSPEEVLDVMKEGKANRQTAATNMNEESSRSHSIFQITIESREHVEGEEECGCVNVSQLNLVDLAGSERAGQTGATGLRFKEGTHINKSLSSLALVIKQLSEDPNRSNRHVNYRDSKLTRILQNSLGGNAKTSIICAVTPAMVEETISTLQFANRAKSIKNKPAVNAVATNATMIQQLTKQLSTLKTELENKKTLEKDNCYLQKQIAALQKLILNGFGQRSTAEILNPRRKLVQPRRITISTLHSIQEDPIPTIPKFCTPSLKYNPLVVSGVPEFQPIQTASSLPTLPEEPVRLVTPPPKDKKVNFDDEIIELDSDDDSTTELQTCPTSPYHKCYESSKTPPCILRKNAKRAEKNLKDIVELTEREKIFTPSVVELMEKLDQNATVITKLEEEINKLSLLSKEKDIEMENLKNKINKAEEEMSMISSAKFKLETICEEYNTKLTDSEVSYETLKKKAKSREEELLSLLEEHSNKKTAVCIGKIQTKNEKEDQPINFLEVSHDISLVNSDNEKSILTTDEPSQHMPDQVSDLRVQITLKDEKIRELELIVTANEDNVTALEKKCREYQNNLENYKEKLSNLEKEVVNHRSSVDSLNEVIEKQNQSIESVNADIESYKKLVQELQIKLRKKDNINISDKELENLLAAEENFIANNENIQNIIQSFKISIQSKNKEIKTLKTSIEKNELSKINDNIHGEISNKDKEIETLKEEIQTLKNEISKMLLQQTNWLETEKHLNTKLTEFEECNSNLKRENERYLQQIQEINLQYEIHKVELLKKNQEIETFNEKYLKEIEDKDSQIKALEIEISTKNDTISELNKSNEETQKYFAEAKLALSKVQSLVALLTGDIQNVPEIIDNFVLLFSTLVNDLSKLENIATEIMTQKEQLIDLIKQCDNEYVIVCEQIDGVIESLDGTSDMDNVTEKEIDSNNKHVIEHREIHQIISKRQLTYEKLINKINKLAVLLDKKQNIAKLNIHNKDSEIADLKICILNQEKKLDEKTKELLADHQEMDETKRKSDQILKNILNKCIDLTLHFNIENNISCNLENNEENTYEEVLLTLQKIANHIEVTTNKQETSNLEDVLAEAKKQIIELTEQNLAFMNDISRMEATNVDLSDELKKIRQENIVMAEDLEKTGKILDSLRQDLQRKVGEMDSIEVKARQWKDQFDTLDFLMKEQLHALRMENTHFKTRFSGSMLKINDNYFENSESDCTNEYCSEQSQRSDTNIVLKSPLSLVSLCCNRIIDAIKPSESSHKSYSNINISVVNEQHIDCQCDKFEFELKMMKEQNSKLESIIAQLQNNNQDLVRERDEVQNEVKSLLDITYELQKKVVNHRTNLSTLTATTYAENKSLSSQVKFLQHLHNRFHAVCQRDIPEFKNQLNELMTLLKSENLLPSDSIKRFSLPNTLDSTTLTSNFKNESTLDGDLLMLDTNVTLTTTGETTLVGDEQTCFDVTQVCVYNEVACQTVDLVTEPTLLIPQMTASPTESNEIIYKLEELKKENDKLREMVNDYSEKMSCKKRMDVQTSPIKPMGNSDEFSGATYDDLLSTQAKVLNEIDLLNERILSLEAEKTDIQEKYNNLLLEIPSTDALVKKLGIFEKEHNLKVKEIESIKYQLQNKNKELTSLQNENDNLSTQVMEVISELDDLKKEYDDLKTNYTQISENNSQLQSEIEKLKNLEMTAKPADCLQCETKDKLISSLREKVNAESHIRLSRSFSDSDRSSSYNTICTLQNELHAGKEDCNKLKEEVTTIKNHLDRSNLSLTQAMDLDESMGESNNFTCAKDFDLIESKCSMPYIPEEHPVDIYALDKADCLSFYKEITGATQNFDHDFKIIDILKLFYTNVMTKHANEVENLVNKLRDFEDYKKQLEIQLENISKEYSCKTKELQEDATELQSMKRCLTQIKDNILLVNSQQLEGSELVKSFIESVLKPLDSQFGLNSSTVFESILNVVVNKLKTDLDDKSNQCCILDSNMRKIQEELNTMNSNVSKLKSELTEKENDYDLLKKQKESIQEINSAITLDIVKKEQELDKMITEGFRKLLNLNIISGVDMDQLPPGHKNVDSLCELVIKQFNDRHLLAEQHTNSSIQELQILKTTIETKNVELRLLTERLQEKENDLLTQRDLVKDLNQIYDAKVEENNVNFAIIQKLQTLVSKFTDKQNKCLEDQIKDLIQSKEELRTEINNLKLLNNEIIKEKDDYAKLLEESSNTIKENKKQLEAMTSDILVLKESVKENVNIIDNMKLEIKSLVNQNTQLREQLQEKTEDCSRLQMNIKTHEKTAEIQSRMITRLQRQKEEDTEKDKQIGELKQKCEDLQKERDALQHDIRNCREELRLVQGVKETLEAQIAELQEYHKPRLSMEASSDGTRRRRQSIHDSKRFSEDKHDADDHQKMEAVFGARSRNDDFFMDVDGVESNRSTPLRLSKGRESSQFRNDQSDKDEDPPSRPSSVLAARRRRQSLHDLHRSVLSQTPSPHDNPRILRDIQDEEKADDHNSEVTELRKQLTTCQEELEDLREKYKELDEECETCAQYLREREEQCVKLKKEKRALEMAVTELQTQLENPGANRSGRRNSVSDAAVNTDEDWSNLHSVVVDRMSYDAEVEKNKKLSKTIEELRFKKQDLAATVAKMQKALDKKSSHDTRDRELEATKSELRACKEELEELKVRIKELDEECDTCAEYLRERDEQCRKLKEAKTALEAKLKEYEDDASNITLSVRKKRQTLHDQNRHSTTSELVDASTETNDDFLSYQVEKDNSKLPDDTQIKELKRLRIMVERLSQQKAALEQRLLLVPAPTPLYVATGSAIVQNQQLTDVMKENQKLKKINAKLIHICKKRGKTLSESNRENQDPSENV